MAKTPSASFRRVNRSPPMQMIGQRYKSLDLKLKNTYGPLLYKVPNLEKKHDCDLQ